MTTKKQQQEDHRSTKGLISPKNVRHNDGRVIFFIRGEGQKYLTETGSFGKWSDGQISKYHPLDHPRSTPRPDYEPRSPRSDGRLQMTPSGPGTWCPWQDLGPWHLRMDLVVKFNM